MLSVLIKISDEAILMSDYNIYYHIIKNISVYISFLELSEEFHRAVKMKSNQP